MADIFEDGFVDTSQHTYRDFSVPNTDPFGVSIFANTDSDGVPTSYSYSFNQAYAFNAAISGDLNRASGVISGMEDSFTVPVGEDVEFKVGLKINKQNFIIQDSVFYTGAPSQEGEDLSSGLYPIFGYKSEDNDEGKVYTGIYQVCTVRDGSVITRTLRDNIYLDNIQIKQLGTTGAPANGEGGQVHLIQESGQYDSSVPISFRGISGGSGVQVTYDSTNASGGNFIVIDSTGSAGGGGGSCANVGDAADVYVEGTSGPFQFRSVTGAHRDPSEYSSVSDLADVYASVDGNKIQLYSEPWNGENLGSQTAIFKQGNGTFGSKAQFKTLEASTNITFDTSTTDVIKISAAGGVTPSYSNLGAGADVYDESSSSPNAGFRSLTGDSSYPASSAERNKLSTVYAVQETNEIVLKAESWEGENIGAHGENVYKNTTGPAFDTKAQFRKISGVTVNDSSHTAGEQKASVNVETVSDVIKISVDLSTASAIGASSPSDLGGSLPSGTVIVGGIRNTTSGYYNSIAGGGDNTISGGPLNFVGGGSGNDVNFSRLSSSLGGENNDISGSNRSTVLGGKDNLIHSGGFNFLGGGQNNKITGTSYSSIVGGEGNLVTGLNSVLAGGNLNSIFSDYSFIGGGESNIASGEFSIIAGGEENKTFSTHSVVLGGQENTASGIYSFVGAGKENKVLADYGFAAGRNSTVSVGNSGAFVLSDAFPTETLSSGANTLTLNFKSGVYVDSDSGLYINGNPVLTGVSGSEGDTLQIVTDRGATTTNALKSQLISITGGGYSSPVGVNGLHLMFDGTGNAYINAQHNGTSNRHLTFNAGSYNFNLGNLAVDTDTLYVDASNDRVGINEDSVDATLHLTNVGGGVVNQKFERAGASAWRLGIPNGQTYFAFDDTNDDLSGPKLVITKTDGDVGIGTSSPSAKLHIDGGLIVSGTSTTGINIVGESNYYTTIIGNDESHPTQSLAGGRIIGPAARRLYFELLGNDATDHFRFLTSPNNDQAADYVAVHIGNDGKVGIGTNDPDSNLEVRKVANDATIEVTTDGAGAWFFTNSTNQQYQGYKVGHNWFMGQHASNDFVIKNGLQSNGTAVLTIQDTTDNVGIGTTNPQKAAHLYVDGNDGLRIQSSNNHAFTQIMAHNDYSAYIQFRDGANRYWIQSTTDDKLRFRPNATSLESATINFDATGNVGIGVLSPSQKLEVGTNTDVSAQIGRAHVGYVGFGDYAGFAHLDKASTSAYALIQGAAGDTHLNAANGQAIFFRRNHVTVGGFNTNSDFYVDTDTLYVDVSEDRVGINDNTPSYPLDVNGVIRTQSGLLGTQFGSGPCTTIDGFLASTSTEDYGFQNALLMNDLAGFTKWAGVTIATSGLYKTRGGSAGSYTYSDEAGTGDFDRAFQANNHTVGSWYTDSGPDGDITTGAANSGSIELYFNNIKSLNYSAQAAVLFGSASFRATHVKIEALRTGAWQTILDETGNSKTALIARIASNGGGANATTGLRYTFARAGSYFRINNLYAADYDLGNDLSYGGQYYIDKYYDGRHYSTLRPVVSGEADLGTNTVRYGDLYSTRGRITNKFGVGNDTLTYPLNVGGAEDTLADFKSSDNKAGILIRDNDTAGYVSAENDKFSIGPNNGTHTGNLTIDLTNSRVGIGTNAPAYPLDVVGTIHGTSGNFENGITIDGNPVVTGSSAEDSDTLQTVTDRGATTTNSITGAGFFIKDGSTQIGQLSKDISSSNFIVKSSVSDANLEFKGVDGGANITAMIIDMSEGGKVGIGTTGPARNLSVASSSTNALIQLANSTTTYAADNGLEIFVSDNDAGIVNRENGYLRFDTNNIERVRILANGNVGIGTTAAAQKLTVKGGVSATNASNIPVATLTNSSEDGRLVLNQAAGVTRVLLDTDGDSYFNGGNLGLGLTDPDEKLEVDGNIKIGADKWYRFGGNAFQIGVDGSSVGMHFHAGSSEKMTLLAGGNVGIGTTTPDGKLHVETATSSQTASTQADELIVENSTHGGISILTPDASRAHLYFNQGAFLRWQSSLLTIDTSNSAHHLALKAGGGNVGIGTTAPAQLLDVYGSESRIALTSSAGRNTVLQQGGGHFHIKTSHTNGVAINNNESSAGRLAIYSGTAENIRFASNGDSWITGGDVGIGTTAPQETLHVYSTSNSRVEVEATTEFAALKATNNQGSYGWYVHNTTDSFRLFDFGASTDYITVSGNGNVGIGTNSPAVNLHVESSSSAQFKVGNGTQFVRLYADADEATILADGSVDMRFYTAGAEKMRLDTDGNVGIGTNDPAQKLEVVGQAIIDGGVGVNSSATLHLRQKGDTLNDGLAITSSHATSHRIWKDGNGKLNIGPTSLPSSFVQDLNGNVGIGTSDPDVPLEVTMKSTELMNLGSSGPNATLQFAAGSSTIFGGIGARQTNTSQSALGLLASTTNASTATYGDMFFSTRENDSSDFSTTAGKKAFSFVRYTSALMTIMRDGKVGIGTTNPSVQLEVTGDIFANGGPAGGRSLALKRTGATNAWKLVQGHTQTDYLEILEGSDTRFLIKNGGNVGIGTNDPQKNLDIQGQFMVRPTSNTTIGRVLIGSTSSDAYLELKDASSNNKVFLNTDGVSYFNGGNVGIGTDNPASPVEVALGGSFNTLNLANLDNGSIGFGNNAGSNKQPTIAGISNDSIGLHLIGATNNTNTLGDVVFDARENNNSTFADTTKVAFGFNTYSTRLVSILRNGSVGIGTTGPQSKLHVGAGDIRVDNAKSILGETNGGGNFQMIKIDTSDNMLIGDGNLVIDINGTSERMKIESAGNVRIGTNTNFPVGTAAGGKLDVRGTSDGQLIFDSDGGSQDIKASFNLELWADYDNGSSAGFSNIIFKTDGDNERVRIDNAGNVGIGTTSPSNALDVVGHFSATSKSFLIDHPTKENKKLQYGSLEGPENGVYVRGTTHEDTVELPEYWSELVHDESITVVLTPIGKKQDLFIIKKSNKLIKIGGVEGSYDYIVYGERKDIDRLEVEPDGN